MNFERANGAKNLFKSMRTPAVLVLMLVINYCMQELFQTVSMSTVAGVFSSLFMLIFLVLTTWTYNRYSGRFRELGKRIDDGVEWIWDMLYRGGGLHTAAALMR